MQISNASATEIICNNEKPVSTQRPIYIDCFEKEKVLETLATASVMIIFNKKVEQSKKENNLCIYAFEQASEIPDYLFARQKAKELIKMCNDDLRHVE